MKRSIVSLLLILCLVSGLCAVHAEEQPIAVGEKVVFGSFDQDNDPANGQETLTWLVLDEKDGDLMLLSVYGLVPKAYHAPTREAVTWENCTLRAWLNGEFYDTAFTDEEKEAVRTTLVDNSAAQCNPAWKTTGGNDTEDKVYLLSWSEVGISRRTPTGTASPRIPPITGPLSIPTTAAATGGPVPPGWCSTTPARSTTRATGTPAA